MKKLRKEGKMICPIRREPGKVLEMTLPPPVNLHLSTEHPSAQISALLGIKEYLMGGPLSPC